MALARSSVRKTNSMSSVVEGEKETVLGGTYSGVSKTKQMDDSVLIVKALSMYIISSFGVLNTVSAIFVCS